MRALALAALLAGCSSAAIASMDAAPTDDAARASDAGSDAPELDAAPSPDAWTSDAWATPDAPPACTLVPSSGCGGDACRIGDDGAPVCRMVSGNPGANHACALVSECAAGLQCLSMTGAAMEYACVILCRVGVVADCPATRMCRTPTLFNRAGNEIPLPAGFGICAP